MLIKPARQSAPRAGSKPGPQHWDDLPHGQWWRTALQHWLVEQDPIVFGHYMIHLSGLDVPWPDSRVKESYAIHPGLTANVRADLTHLPLANDSVDWITLVHALEYCADPHQVLREADRALRTDGRMILVMTNPLALHNALRWWPSLRGQVPWNGRLFSAARIRDWLSLLNYEILSDGYYGYGCPLPARANPERYVKPILQKLPCFAAGYVLIVRKREWPLTLTRSLSRQRHKLSDATAVPLGQSRGS
ncbi:MAG: class I SAM-dependent methyltransferase [Idiomarina sp.]|nr:class I SAM-dependent methyltransferase [Idiomarina sp.]